MRVYLAYAIDQQTQAGLAESVADLEYLRLILSSRSETSWVFDPGKAFSVGQFAEPETGLREINQYALKTADLVVAYLPAGVASVGVPMEIDRAAAMGKLVLVISDAKSWMLQFGQSNVRVVSGVSEADEALDGLLAPPLIDRAGNTPREPLPVALDEVGQMPDRTYANDAGLDLFVSETVDVPPGEFRDIHCGVLVQLPDWSWGMLTGRSSTLRKRGLLVNQGVIDEGYRGPLFAGVWNLTAGTVRVNKGERIAQLIVLDNATRKLHPHQVRHLSVSERGNNGFGSTGA